MKQYTRYAVIDIETGLLLACGERNKNLWGLPYVGSFRRGLFGYIGKKQITLARIATIKKRKCIIVYWPNAPLRKEFNCVLLPGRLVGMKGEIYNNTRPRVLQGEVKYVLHELKRTYYETPTLP